MFRSVDTACNLGMPHRVAAPPLSEGPASLPPILSGGDGVSGVRNKSDAEKTGNFSGGRPLGVAGFPIKHLLNQSEKLNKFIPHTHFKMEGIHMVKTC